MAAWVAAGDLVAGPGVAPAVGVAAVAVAVDPTVAWAAATVTGSAPTRECASWHPHPDLPSFSLHVL